MIGADHPANKLVVLRDLADVHGSFLVAPGGQLLARDMPPVFPDDLLGEVAARLVRLADVFTCDSTVVQSYLIRYLEHFVFVRSIGAGALCVLANAGVNLAALRMSANLVARQLSQGEVPSTTSSSAELPAVPRTHPALPLPAGDVAGGPTGAGDRPTIKWRGGVMPRGR